MNDIEQVLRGQIEERLTKERIKVLRSQKAARYRGTNICIFLTKSKEREVMVGIFSLAQLRAISNKQDGLVGMDVIKACKALNNQKEALLLLPSGEFKPILIDQWDKAIDDLCDKALEELKS